MVNKLGNEINYFTNFIHKSIILKISFTKLHLFMIKFMHTSLIQPLKNTESGNPQTNIL